MDEIVLGVDRLGFVGCVLFGFIWCEDGTGDASLCFSRDGI